MLKCLELVPRVSKRPPSFRNCGLIFFLFLTARELAPSSRIVDAFPRPPTFRVPERSTPNRRRSADSALLLGSMDDVNPDDPVFILRRAVSYRNLSSRHRLSAPLDELALHQFHRDSYSSASSSDPNTSHDSSGGYNKPPASRQEIIARQREATRANQRAILSAQTNSVRGMDVLLPGNAMLRSSRYDSTDRMRYSYVERDGETYDISDIVEEELRDNSSGGRSDLLESVLGRKDAVGERLNRVLSKIKSGKQREKEWAARSSLEDSRRSASISEYSMDEAGADRAIKQRSVSPAGGTGTPLQSRSLSDKGSRPGTATPTGRPAAGTAGNNRRNPSIASVMSDLSGYDTAVSHPGTPLPTPSSPNQRSFATPTPTLKQQEPTKSQQQLPPQRRIRIPKDDFGLSHMMAIIECKSSQPRAAMLPPPLHPADELLFGRPIDLEGLHPSVKEIYGPGFKQLEEFDKVCVSLSLMS